MKIVPFYEGLTYDRLENGGLQWPNSHEGPKSMLTLDDLKKPLEFAADK
jgi:predicted molibdopterin-dependent oxidoreductase YjgC